jgi:hypothetical protein
MRVMVIVKANEESEAGALPNPELIAAMGAYNNELIAAGVMLDGGGLQSSAKGARVSLRNGKASVTDGPFAETKELIGGFWVIQCKDMDEALSWARRVPFEDGEIELRPYHEPEDLKGLASDEVIAQEQGWREEQERNAPKTPA